MKLILTLFLALFPVLGFANAPVATWGGAPGADRIDLFDERGHCPPGARRASYFVADPRANGALIAGCWMVRGTVVWMAFDDGDQGGLNVTDFRWRGGIKPLGWM